MKDVKKMAGEKVYYQFPATMDAGEAARAYMKAAGGVQTARRYNMLKYLLGMMWGVFVPRPMAARLMEECGGTVHKRRADEKGHMAAGAAS